MTRRTWFWIAGAGVAALILWTGGKKVVAIKREIDLGPLADETADRHGVNRVIFRSIISAESSWNPNAVSGDKGAYGLGQLRKITVKQYRPDLVSGWPGSILPPEVNLDIAAQFVRDIGRAGIAGAEAFHAYYTGITGYKRGDRNPDIGNYVTAYNRYLTEDANAAG